MSWKDLYSEKDFTEEEFDRIIETSYTPDLKRFLWVDDGKGDKRKNPNKKRRIQSGFESDERPFGCATCGGDYPNCKSSCPIFDD